MDVPTAFSRKTFAKYFRYSSVPILCLNKSDTFCVQNNIHENSLKKLNFPKQIKAHENMF